VVVIVCTILAIIAATATATATILHKNLTNYLVRNKKEEE